MKHTLFQPQHASPGSSHILRGKNGCHSLDSPALLSCGSSSLLELTGITSRKSETSSYSIIKTHPTSVSHFFYYSSLYSSYFSLIPSCCMGIIFLTSQDRRCQQDVKVEWKTAVVINLCRMCMVALINNIYFINAWYQKMISR